MKDMKQNLVRQQELFPPRVLSYGGGLDSFAVLLDAIERRDVPDVCVFVDVGNGTASRDSTVPAEWAGTYRHMREVVMPLCARHGIEFVWIDSDSYPVRDAASLFEWLWARKQIPVAGPNRICTTVAKVERFENWAATRFGASAVVEVWVGFEAGEEARAQKDPNTGAGRKRPSAWVRRKNRFPLIERRLCRCRCEALVRRHGLALPRKSACAFCPYGSLTDWQTFAREDPKGFAITSEMEARKPPTVKNGKKLSIMGYRTFKDAAGNVTGYRAPPLAEYVKGMPIGKRKPCTVCGAAERATKATGCDYLEEATAA